MAKPGAGTRKTDNATGGTVPAPASARKVAPSARSATPAREPRFPLLAERLRQARAEAGHTQRVCARLCGVGQQTWASWEIGHRAPKTADQMQALCDLLHADPGWLLGLTNVRRPWPPRPGDERMPAAAARRHGPAPDPEAVAAPDAVAASPPLPPTAGEMPAVAADPLAPAAASSTAGTAAVPPQRVAAKRRTAAAGGPPERPAPPSPAATPDPTDRGWLLRLAEPERFGAAEHQRGPSRAP